MKKIGFLFFLFAFVMNTNAQEKTMQLSLRQAIEFALENSYNAKVAINDIESAKKKVWETTTISLPQINGDGVNEEFVFGTKQNMNVAVTLRQLLFDGSYLVGLQASKTFLKISEQAQQKTEYITREAVINAYGNVLITESTITVLESNIKILQKNYNDAKKIFENGLNEEEDVEQLEITLGNLKNQLNNVIRMK